MTEEFEGTIESRDISRYRDRIVNGPVIRTIFWLGLPPLLNQIVFVAYNLADTYWLSCYSELTVSVPRQVMPVIMLFQAFVMAANTACLTIVSQYVGAKAFRNASSEASRFFTVAFLLGVGMNISLLTLRNYIFTWLVFTPPEIFEEVMTFSAITAFDVFFNAVAFTFTTLLQGVGDTKRPAMINIVAVAINVLLDPFLVLGIGPFPRLGVAGAALTDVMGKIISIIGQTYVLRKSYPALKVKFTKDINAEWVRLVLRIGLPIFAFASMNGFAFLLQQRLVNMLGIVAATAFSIGFVMINTVDAALFGLSQAPAIMIGQSLGADNPKRAREVAFKAAMLLFVVIAVGACVVYPFKRVVADVFVDGTNILKETETFLEISLPTLPFFGLCMNAVSVGRGSGNTAFPTAVDIARIWGLRVALGYYLAFAAGLGSVGVWSAISLSNVIGGIVFTLWVKYGNWNKKVIRHTSIEKFKAE